MVFLFPFVPAMELEQHRSLATVMRFNKLKWGGDCNQRRRQVFVTPTVSALCSHTNDGVFLNRCGKQYASVGHLTSIFLRYVIDSGN